MRRSVLVVVWFIVFVVFCKEKPSKVKEIEEEEEEDGEEDSEDICPFPWQTHDQNVLAQYSMCSEVMNDGVKCTPHDPIECTGRNPSCVFSKVTNDHRCCADVPQDLSNPPGIPEQVKPICPYGASSYDLPSVLLCDPTEDKACPEMYTCEQAVNHQMLTTYNMHLCCKTSTLDSFENVFYETKVGINKMSSNLSMPIFYVTQLSPSIVPIAPSGGIDYVVLNEYIPTKSKSNTPEIRTGDHFAMLPYRFREPVYLKKVFLFHEPMPNFFFHVLVLFNPHGNPESMNLYYNRPSSLSREIDLSVPVWDEGVFFRNMNRVLTIQSDQTSSRQIRRLYIVLVFKTKFRITKRHPQTWNDLHANYTTFTEFLGTETGKQLGNPMAGTYYYITK
ncbi:unnamed protein product [Caenorhabditis nigoni]|uniref:Domain of unknown function DX domain-containing protein n=1 Tax=Caenorhabditis nigoni TaxID=1611254 RepID=A0A2G5SV74_9PELO|nr:hypothetical protein B9Z55_024587 [Caenorhabditis nigoni]